MTSVEKTKKKAIPNVVPWEHDWSPGVGWVTDELM